MLPASSWYINSTIEESVDPPTFLLGIGNKTCKRPKSYWSKSIMLANENFLSKNGVINSHSSCLFMLSISPRTYSSRWVAKLGLERSSSNLARVLLSSCSSSLTRFFARASALASFLARPDVRVREGEGPPDPHSCGWFIKRNIQKPRQTKLQNSGDSANFIQAKAPKKYMLA